MREAEENDGVCELFVVCGCCNEKLWGGFELFVVRRCVWERRTRGCELFWMLVKEKKDVIELRSYWRC
jgi:hypothetical protein